MSLLDAITLSAAEKIWKTAGPRAGVIAYRNLLQKEADDTRAAAILSGIECAIEASDEHAAYGFAEAWAFVKRGDLARGVVGAAAKLEARGFGRAAHLLLTREHERAADPVVSYALGRVCARRGLEGDAIAAFRACLRAPRREASRALVAYAALEVARRAARDPATLAESLELARSIDPTALTPRAQMHHARILLASKSRFERAGALSRLVDLGRGTPKLATRAARYAAAHADRMGRALTPLEADRVAAALACEPNEAARASALSRLASLTGSGTATLDEERRIVSDPGLAQAVVRAKAVLAGGLGPPMDARVVNASATSRLSDAALSAIAELRRGSLRAPSLAKVAELSHEQVRPFPRSAFTLALLVLGADDPSLYAAAAEIATCAMAADASSPRGMRTLGLCLARRGADELALRALRIAVVREEPGAEEALSTLLVMRAKSAMGSDRADVALPLLSEARAIHLSKRAVQSGDSR